MAAGVSENKYDVYNVCMEQTKPNLSRKQRVRTYTRAYERPLRWWEFVGLPLILFGLLIPTLCAKQVLWIEQVYCHAIYPRIIAILSALTRPFPFSIAEFLLYGLLLWAVIKILISFVAWALGHSGVRRVIRALLSVCLVGGILWNLFYITWGLNYFRMPLRERMGLTVCARSVEELEALTSHFLTEAGALRATLAEDETGSFTLSGALETVLTDLPDAYARLGAAEPVLSGVTSRAKRVFFSTGLSWAGICGIYIGLTGEPNINIDQPDLLLPQAAAHEMAHQLGIASENEAEFIAHLACLCSPDARVRYSGLLYGLIVCGNALAHMDRERYSALRQTYPDTIVRDLASHKAYWDRYEGPVEQAATNMNDQYLKHNAQESGVSSYGESVDLLLAYYDLIKN